MSQRFYFDLEDGQETIRDGEGVEADGPEDALEAAQEIIAEMAGEVASADPRGRWTLVVRDAVGEIVGRLPVV
ncbi:hypothetical protein Q8W71_14055 [Methylobacterium sp. NEAU 140]|uniref:DUF6894 family protein n=1 Tax=Methylobacterium sp. NEAU 140 TaxID=3064945 RepID=UPI0027325017|nr:hypothetical protein [Methylobacterium sp. NEAU 140]MDP4023755.1 hypothetical protein [Methylobacterium sp. NEAU 140]